MIKRIQQYIYNRRCDKALDEAVELSKKTGRKYLVVLVKGRPVAVSKKTITNMVRARRFKKGVTVREIEQNALFVTAPRKSN